MRIDRSPDRERPYRHCPSPTEPEAGGDISVAFVVAVVVLLVVLVRVFSVEPAPGERFGRLGPSHLFSIEPGR